MSRRILIEKGELALMQDQQLLVFSPAQTGAICAEQIYLGKVDRIVKGMEAAFVQIGKDQTGFLPFSECRERPRSGDRILVQVKKPPIGEKAAYLTADIALAGRCAVLTPLTPRFAVSKRIEDEAQKNVLLEMSKRLSPVGMGLVMRSEAAGESEPAISDEIRALTAQWEEILEKGGRAQPPCLIRDRESALSRLLRDEHGAIEEILTDDPDAVHVPNLPVRRCENPFALYSVKSKWEKARLRKVWLDCGGYLVIDRTEALTVIDVNSGKFTGGKAGTESTFLRLNLEAAREIARLLRLRNLGGIILIDFVDMRADENREAVAEELRTALKTDPAKTVLHDFTSLGLMEMTRKKTEEPT